MPVNTFEVYDVEERLEQTNANTNSRMSGILLKKYEIVKKCYLTSWLQEAKDMSKCIDPKKHSDNVWYASRFAIIFLFYWHCLTRL
jgi:hypothetical protein